MIRDRELPTKVKLQFHFVRNLSSDCLNRRHDLENVHLSMKGTKRNEKEKKRSQQNRRTKENHQNEINKNIKEK